ncbi:hypothetical protein [Brevifollis gellanilyticus]|uniref:Uncharacterized protein n=1 Tax=Brevifollis gellanilyticus TaxID=748831 RepID=A0A512MGE4_9BACT|nr:hypothetical protein [Brevifollis gellanilyticus]GEP45812.1 hypothetical protein BGE01nite_51030 [Brevifollis gellanilyticus]
MSLLRSIILIFAVLAQAMPVQAMMRGAQEPVTCEMGCCAAVASTEMDACACADTSAPAKPLNTPPASGRDLVPQVVWTMIEEMPSLTSVSMNLEKKRERFIQRDPVKQSHVRLPVLFCAFLN